MSNLDEMRKHLKSMIESATMALSETDLNQLSWMFLEIESSYKDADDALDELLKETNTWNDGQ